MVISKHPREDYVEIAFTPHEFHGCRFSLVHTKIQQQIRWLK
jgi:hypothetical protein